MALYGENIDFDESKGVQVVIEFRQRGIVWLNQSIFSLSAVLKIFD
jgi:hypothetical protein